MLLSFLLSMALSWVYTITYQGLSYSRGFVQTIALGGVVSALVMLAIGNDIARGLGLVGALTVVRFRTTLKDTRDLMFIFASFSFPSGTVIYWLVSTALSITQQYVTNYGIRGRKTA